LNLMLLPVNFAGILASIVQLVTGRKGSFMRTPKVAKRTYVPPYALLFNLGVLLLMLAYATRAVMYGEYSGAVIPIMNILLYSYGLIRFVGILDSIGDMFPALRRWALACTDALSRLARLSVPFLPPLGNRYVTVPGLAVALILMTPVPSGSRIATEPVPVVERAMVAPTKFQKPSVIAPIVYPAIVGSMMVDHRTLKATGSPIAPRSLVTEEPLDARSYSEE